MEDGRITGHGQDGRALIGVTRIKMAGREIPFKAVQYELLRPEPQVGEGFVRFLQTAGGHMGLPAPRIVRGKPFFRITSSSAWTTLALTMYADGRVERELTGASPFPRHFVYDDEGRLVQKSGVIDFKAWYRESHGGNTPWGDEDSPALVTQVESELEREIGEVLMQGGGKSRRQSVSQGETLVRQGDEGTDVFLVLDGVFSVEIDGEQVAELGPGAIVGERAAFEGGARTATLTATTPARVAVFDVDCGRPRAARGAGDEPAGGESELGGGAARQREPCPRRDGEHREQHRLDEPPAARMVGGRAAADPDGDAHCARSAEEAEARSRA